MCRLMNLNLHMAHTHTIQKETERKKKQMEREDTRHIPTIIRMISCKCQRPKTEVDVCSSSAVVVHMWHSCFFYSSFPISLIHLNQQNMAWAALTSLNPTWISDDTSIYRDCSIEHHLIIISAHPSSIHACMRRSRKDKQPQKRRYKNYE